MHHIFINENQILNDIIIINKIDDKENFNHLINSLRIKINERVLVSVINFKFSFDYITEIENIDNEKVVLKVLEESEPNELKIKINLYQGIPKLDKLEFIIEKAVELGIFSITPVSMENCVAKIKQEKTDNKIDRLNRISKSASIQSKRHIIPCVKTPIFYNQMIEEIKNNKFNLLFYEEVDNFETTRTIFSEIKDELSTNNKFDINIIIGPEGGFSKKEIDIAIKNELSILSLGKRILRTETASVVALSMLNYILE